MGTGDIPTAYHILDADPGNPNWLGFTAEQQEQLNTLWARHREILWCAREGADILEQRESPARYWESYSPEELSEIEKLCRPSRGMPIGMIRPDSNLSEVLRRQNTEVEALSPAERFTHEEAAKALLVIFESYWKLVAMDSISDDGSVRIGNVEIVRHAGRGVVVCPFCAEQRTSFDAEYVVANHETAQVMLFAGMHPHLIQHGLFEEKDSVQQSDSEKGLGEQITQVMSQLFSQSRTSEILSQFTSQNFAVLNGPYYVPTTHEVWAFITTCASELFRGIDDTKVLRAQREITREIERIHRQAQRTPIHAGPTKPQSE